MLNVESCASVSKRAAKTYLNFVDLQYVAASKR